MQAGQDKAFGTTTCPMAYTPKFASTGSYQVSKYTYQYWNGTSWVAGGTYTLQGANVCRDEYEPGQLHVLRIRPAAMDDDDSQRALHDDSKHRHL